MAIPLGDVAGGRATLPLVGNLHGVESQGLGLIFHWPKPVPESRRGHQKRQHRQVSPPPPPGPLPWPAPSPAGLVAVGMVWDARKVFIPAQPRHHLVPLPHVTLEVPAHRHHLWNPERERGRHAAQNSLPRLGGTLRWAAAAAFPKGINSNLQAPSDLPGPAASTARGEVPFTALLLRECFTRSVLTPMAPCPGKLQTSSRCLG